MYYLVTKRNTYDTDENRKNHKGGSDLALVKKEGIDSVTIGEGVLYLSTVQSLLTQSALVKLVSQKIYQDMTIRNYNTTQKLLALMEQR